MNIWSTHQSFSVVAILLMCLEEQQLVATLISVERYQFSCFSAHLPAVIVYLKEPHSFQYIGLILSVKQHARIKKKTKKKRK